jgi:dolichol kinase
MLSHDEDRHLRAIEQWFEQSDPEFTRMLRNHEAPERRRQRKALRVGIYLTGGLLAVIGTLAAVAIVMVLGILVLAAGACLQIAARQ